MSKSDNKSNHHLLCNHSTAYCIWSVFHSKFPAAISLASIQRNVAKKTRRTRSSIEIRDWRNDSPNAIGCIPMLFLSLSLSKYMFHITKSFYLYVYILIHIYMIHMYEYMNIYLYVYIYIYIYSWHSKCNRLHYLRDAEIRLSVPEILNSKKFLTKPHSNKEILTDRTKKLCNGTGKNCVL